MYLEATTDSIVSVQAQAEEILSRAGDTELTIRFAPGLYRLRRPFRFDAGEKEGVKRLRLLGSDSAESATVLSALADLDTDLRKERGDGTVSLYPFAGDDIGRHYAFYKNGQAAEVARGGTYESAPAFTLTQPDGTVFEYSAGVESWRQTNLIYLPETAVKEAGLSGECHAELHIRIEWEFKIFCIVAVDTDSRYTDADGTVYVAVRLDPRENRDGCVILSFARCPFYICNTPALLTQGGDYAYDRRTGELVLRWEPNGENRYSYATADALVSVRGLDSVTAENLTFTGTEDAIMTAVGYYSARQAGSWSAIFPEGFSFSGAVRAKDVSRFEFSRCSFSELPCDALSMTGLLSRVSIRDCQFTRIGACAVCIGRPEEERNPATDRVEDISVEYNTFDGTGLRYLSSCSLLVTKCRDGRIRHNTFLHASYTALSVGWKWDKATWEYGTDYNLNGVEIAYNYVSSFMMRMRDGGAVYTLGGNTEVHGHAAVMNTVHDNFIREDAESCPSRASVCLYHDGASSNWHTYNNVVIHNPVPEEKSGSRSACLYIQRAWTDGPCCASTAEQAAWHILCENNYFGCCKGMSDVLLHNAYVDGMDIMDASRDILEKNTHLFPTEEKLSLCPEAAYIMQNAGNTRRQ